MGCVLRKAAVCTFAFFLIAFMLINLLYAESTNAEIYKWVDDNGVTHYSNNLQDIPPDKLNPPDTLSPQQGKKLRQNEPKSEPVDETPQGEVSLNLPKSSFTPGETIEVDFRALSTYASDAWIGIIPSEVPHGDEASNDRYDISYKYLKKKTSGQMTFKAPNKPGFYDLRMHDTDSSGMEVASVSFMVEGEYDIEGTLTLDKDIFNGGDDIKVSFTSSSAYAKDAWIGVIPSDVPHGDETVNDRHDMSYQYIKGLTSGDMVFKAPLKPGEYDLRMHDTDSNGTETASVSFTVVQ